MVMWAVVPFTYILLLAWIAEAVPMRRSQRRVRIISADDLAGSSPADLVRPDGAEDGFTSHDASPEPFPNMHDSAHCTNLTTNEIISIDPVNKWLVSHKKEDLGANETESIPVASQIKVMPTVATVGHLNLAVHVPSSLFELTVLRIEALQKEAIRRGLLQERRHSKFGHLTLHTYLHMAMEDFPDVVDNLWTLTGVSNDVAGWGVASGRTSKPSLRCIEIVEYTARSHPAPPRHSGWHDDGDTVFTVSVLLSEPGRDFEGGDIEFRRKLSEANPNVQVSPRFGDAVIWRGWEEHRVLPVTRGSRRVLVAEWRLDAKAASETDVRPPDSEEGLRRLQQLDPSSATIYKNLGNLLLARGKGNAAASAYASGLARDPTYAEGHYHLGSLALENGVIQLAEKHFRSAIRFEPLHVQSQSNLGVIFDRRGEKKAAEKLYLAALRTDPEHAEAHDNLGVLQASVGDISSAETSFEAAVKANPEHVNGHRNLGVIRKKRGNLQGAEKSFQMVAKLSPNNADAQISLADVLAKQSKAVQAAVSFNAAFEIDPYHKGAHSSLLSHHKLVFQLNHCLDKSVTEQLQCLQMLIHLESMLNRAETVVDLSDFTTAAKYHSAVLQGKEPSRPPASYVEKLFDSYAAKFEAHLTGALQYDGPRLVQKELRSAAAQTKMAQFQRAADLGCGTGLMAARLRNLGVQWLEVQWLEGVDVSSKMLEKAASKRRHEGYDTLLKADFQSVFRPLASKSRPEKENMPIVELPGIAQAIRTPNSDQDLFDMVTLVDVAEYIGDLEGMFETLRKWMMSGGLFGLTVLVGDDSNVFEDYVLVPPGLYYIHRPQYVHRLAQRYGFKVLRETQAVLRYQSAMPVRAQVFVLQA
jgi:predicted TPR repeat methyltransferase